MAVGSGRPAAFSFSRTTSRPMPLSKSATIRDPAELSMPLVAPRNWRMFKLKYGFDRSLFHPMSVGT